MSGKPVRNFFQARPRILMVSMAKKQTVVAQKKKQDPAPRGINPMIGVRMPHEELARLDAFIADQPEPMNRPEASEKPSMIISSIGAPSKLWELRE